MKTAFQHTASRPFHITIRTLAIVGSLWFMAILAPTAAGQTQPNFELPRTPDETPAMGVPRGIFNRDSTRHLHAPGVGA